MSTWLDSFLKQNPRWRDHPVYKVARHSIHFRADDGIHAFFVGQPAFERNARGLWVPVQESIIPRLWQKLAALQSPEVQFRMRAFVIAGRLSPFATTTDFPGDTGDGYVYGRNATYATARSTNYTYQTSDTIFYVGQNKDVSYYYCYRGAVKFDTHTIGAGQAVSQVNLKLTPTVDNSDTDFIVQIAKYDWSASDPIGNTNRSTVYNGILAAAQDATWRGTSGISVNTQYASNNLATAWVAMTGTTYYGLISDRDHDGSGTAPSGLERLSIASQNNGTVGYRPLLTVVYAPAATGRSFTVIVG